VLLVAANAVWSTTRTEHIDTALSRSWQLPPKATMKDDSVVAKEFQFLDISNEGKLSFRGVRAALDLAGVTFTDEGILKWIAEADINNKGFVDFEDYRNLHRPALRNNPIVTVNTNNSQILKSIFSDYDRDKDGYITLKDLIKCFGIDQQDSLKSWIDLLDKSSSQRVSFDDFAFHFNG
jgi:Ca2+-binding EF-hand superfamily protein